MVTHTLTVSASRTRPARDDARIRRLVPRVVSLLARIRGEYLEMPGLKLTEAQARRLWDLDRHTCGIALKALLDQRFLERTAEGAYVRAGSGRSAHRGPSATRGEAIQHETPSFRMKGMVTR